MMSSPREEIQNAAARLRLDAFAKYNKYFNSKHTFEENLSILLQEQVKIADNTRLKRRVNYAGFPQIKTLNTFSLDKEYLPNLNFDEFAELSACKFIDEKNDIVAIGPTGRGKTHAALAIGYEAVKLGYSVRFKKASEIVNEMMEAKTEKRLTDYIRVLNRCQLLIVDELGYLNYDIKSASLLFNIISDRYEKASTMYTTNLAFSKWPQFISDEALAAAIIDRIAHHAIVLNMNGPKCWRMEHARSKMQTSPVINSKE